jgi:hypothetical protein
MMGKVPKIRYVDHDVHNVAKFPDLAEETYLIKTMEVGPLDKPIVEPA